MQKVKDLKSLEKFSTLYKDYKILNFDSGNIKKEDFESNTKLILSSLQHLVPIIDEFDNISEIKPEIKFGLNTRFDFLVSNEKKKSLIEVKNVTLSREKAIAEFPDAVTTRGLKHINELLKASKKNYKIFILYLIQRDDCKSFTIARDIDPQYASALTKAVKNKLNVLCYDCKFSTKGIKLNNKIKLKIK